MKITFIQPGINSIKISGALQPLSYAILSALTPPETEKVFYDDRIEDISLDEPTDLVAMSVDTFSARRAYSLAEEYQKRNVPVVLGGFHPTLCPQEASGRVPTIAIGDAESIWPEIIKGWKEKRLKNIYRSQASPLSLDTAFDRTIYSGKKYNPIHVVQWGRGCPHQCDFCSIHAFYGSWQSLRPIDAVIEELDKLTDAPIFFVDDNIYHHKKTFTLFLSALSSLKIRWICQISLDVAGDRDLIKLMEKSGCLAVVVGFESLNQKNLVQMGKAWNRNGTGYDTAVEVFRDHGIMIYGTFVFGYDEDTPDSVKKCLDFALRSRFLIANFNPLTPTPGTTLYNRLAEERRIIYPQWWIDPDYRYGHAIFRPRKMTPEELTNGCFEARKTFNTYSSIVTRMFDFNTNMKSLQNTGIYLRANLTNRREMYNKQGKALGL